MCCLDRWDRLRKTGKLWFFNILSIFQKLIWMSSVDKIALISGTERFSLRSAMTFSTSSGSCLSLLPTLAGEKNSCAGF